MRHGFRLGDIGQSHAQDDLACVDDVAERTPREDRRLMREATRRMGCQPEGQVQPKKLSKVERFMEKNAHAYEERRAQAQQRREVEIESRWPRPRLLALIVVITLAAVVPSVAIRLLIWFVIMVLLTAVMLGPERARDGLYVVMRHSARIWGYELHLLRRLTNRGGM